MNESQNNQMPPQQPGPQGPTAQPQAGPQGYGPGYHGGYQDQYQGGYGYPPAPGYGPPPWAHQQHHHRGGHPSYYGPPPQAPGYYPPGYGAYHGHHAYPPHHDSGLGGFFNFRDERFVKGAITGAALTFLLTSDTVQKNAIKSLVKLWSAFQGGIEEVKERFKDAEAEIKTEEQSPKSSNG